MRHPHPDPRHIMVTYRRFILSEKRRFAGKSHNPAAFRKGARGLIHYMDYVSMYLEAKREVLRGSS